MVAGMKTRNLKVQQWWASLSSGERRLICAIMRLLKSARRSQVNDVARAAAKWESGIGFFIKIRLMHQRPRRLLMDHRTTGPQDHGTTGLRDYKTTGLQDYGTTDH